MKKTLFFALFFCAASFVPNLVFAQQIPKDTVGLVVVRTNDDNEYVGSIVSQNAEVIVLKTEALGEITLQKKNIKSIVPLEKGQIVAGEYWFENPHTTRYFFQANGYNLRKGEGYYQNTWIFLNQVSYGVTNNITIGAGMVPLFIFAGTASPVWITPKVSVPVVKDKFNVGAGAFLGTVIGEEESGFGLLYGSATYGPRDRNISLGIGYGFAGGEWSETPAISVSGMVRTGKKFALMMENYFLDAGDETAAISMLGGRFIGKRIAVDAALVLPISELDEGFVALPWLGINVPFGSRK
jgi:hypothetical protein